MSAGRIVFAGCGPGAADLLTVRAVRALASADIVIWNAALLDRRALAGYTRAGAEIVQWPPATPDDIYAAFDRARTEHLLVVRLKGGDPTLFGALEPELSAARERGIACEIVPGVSALSAAAAALGREIATRETALLVVHGGSAAMGSRAPGHVAVYGAGRDPRAVAASLLASGLAPSAPCTVAVEISRPDEAIIACTLAELAETIGDLGRGVLTLVVASDPGVTEHSDVSPSPR